MRRSIFIVFSFRVVYKVLKKYEKMQIKKRCPGESGAPCLCVLCVYECVNLKLLVNHHYQVFGLFPECTRVADFQGLHTVVSLFHGV